MSDQPKGIPGIPPTGVTGAWNDEVRYDLCRRAWELRVEGYPIQDIATQLGVGNRRTITEYIRWWRENGEDENGDNPVQAKRLLAAARLDRLMQVYLPRAVGGDDNATTLLLKIMDREAKLIGYDAALKVDATVTGKAPSPELLARIHAIRDAVAQQQEELEANTIEGETVDELPAGEL